MRYKSIIIAFVLCSASWQLSFAQDLNLIGRLNIGIGFDYLEQDFNGIKTFYSPGGGLGLEAGLEGELPNDLFWYGTLGYTQNLNFHYEDINGESTKTAFGWNKWALTGGVNRMFEVRNKYVENVFAGAGMQIALPGKLRRTENNTYLGKISYNPAVGFHLEGGVTLDVISGFLLRPSVRLRYLEFNAKEYSKGSVANLAPGLKNPFAGGIDISVTLVKPIKGGRR